MEPSGHGRRLAGKTAIVTGAGAGIGRAVCVRFAEEGANVICADRDMETAGETAGIIGETGGGAVGLACDVSNNDDAKKATDVALERFGALHILVNNAATWVADGTVVETSEEDWNGTLAVNLTGPFLMSKHAIPAMIESGGGNIIHVASQFGHVAKPGRSWYCAAKAGLINLARAMAVDHGADNIRVNSLSPGPVGTERTLRNYGGAEAARQVMGVRTLLDRMGRPDEIAAAALFLASDESSFMTGADLLVDGGYAAI